MHEPIQYTTIHLADRLRPVVPTSDDTEAASTVANEVLARTGALQDDLLVIANRHLDVAPASSLHVADLRAALAGVVLDWITEWPA